jgi:hypothetical protein
MRDALGGGLRSRSKQRVLGRVEALDPVDDQQKKLQCLLAPLWMTNDRSELGHARSHLATALLDPRQRGRITRCGPSANFTIREHAVHACGSRGRTFVAIHGRMLRGVARQSWSESAEVRVGIFFRRRMHAFRAIYATPIGLLTNPSKSR